MRAYPANIIRKRERDKNIIIKMDIICSSTSLYILIIFSARIYAHIYIIVQGNEIYEHHIKSKTKKTELQIPIYLYLYILVLFTFLYTNFNQFTHIIALLQSINRLRIQSKSKKNTRIFPLIKLNKIY